MELISRAFLEWKRRVAKNLVPFGTNPKQMFVLRTLLESGPMSPSEIADLVLADRPTATSLIGTIQRAEWVSRRKDPTNGKRVLVHITKRGQAFVRSVPESLWRTGKTAFDPEGCFTSAEQTELIRLLGKLNRWVDSAV
jgi:DNA-binding MarR family transcriptional regulator